MAPRRKVAKSAAGKGKLLSESKVLRILEGMDVDAKDFLKRYATDTQRGPRTVSDEIRKAVEEFIKTGSMEGLKRAIGTKSEATASRAVTRVLAERAKQGEATQ